MYKRILVPTDGSVTADRAVDHALGLAETFDARIDALYVLDKSLAQVPGVNWDTALAGLRETGQEIVDTVVEQARARGIEATGTIKEAGNPHQGILEYADAQGVDAIVMGTHGRSGFARFLIGSVAERVLRSTTAPVLLVPDPDDER